MTRNTNQTRSAAEANRQNTKPSTNRKAADLDEAERSVEEFRNLSGRGHSRGRRFERDDAHNRK
jgi:hypothetical protein